VYERTQPKERKEEKEAEMKREIIVFQWKDASIQVGEQLSRSKWENARLIEGIVAGHIIHENKERIIIGMDLFYKQEDIPEDDFRNVAVYPKSGIVKIIKRFELKE